MNPRAATLENADIHISAGHVVSVIIASVAAFVGWIIRVSARQMLKSFEDALTRHGSSIDRNTVAIERMQIHLAEIDARLSVIERE